MEAGAHDDLRDRQPEYDTRTRYTSGRRSWSVAASCLLQVSGTEQVALSDANGVTSRIHAAERAGDLELVHRTAVRDATWFFGARTTGSPLFETSLGGNRLDTGPGPRAPGPSRHHRSVFDGEEYEHPTWFGPEGLSDRYPKNCLAMSEEEFDHIKADIAARGQLEPIWTHRGRVVDGRHRLRLPRAGPRAGSPRV